MRVLSLFSGAGGADLALEAAGFDVEGLCEIEPHARAVLREHWPAVRLHADVADLDGTEYAGRVDVVVGGSPCQDLSVAGKRAGLAEGSGTRSSLFFEQVRIWRETGAPYLIWENVKGAFSSAKGADFAAVLSAVVGDPVAVPPGGWGGGGVVAGREAVAAWRLLDLQHFGVPQRRARVVVVAARAGGVDPAEVLALGEDVFGDPAPFTEARGAAAAAARGGAFGDGAQAVNISGSVARLEPLMGTLGVRSGGREVGAQTRGVVITHTTRAFRMVAFGEYAEDGLASAIKARDYKDATDLVVHPGLVRRLMPIECERLMGWPDDWTRWGVNEKGVRYELKDTPRYRLCGNGIGREWMEWIASRLLRSAASLEAA